MYMKWDILHRICSAVRLSFEKQRLRLFYHINKSSVVALYITAVMQWWTLVVVSLLPVLILFQLLFKGVKRRVIQFGIWKIHSYIKLKSFHFIVAQNIFTKCLMTDVSSCWMKLDNRVVPLTYSFFYGSILFGITVEWWRAERLQIMFPGLCILHTFFLLCSFPGFGSLPDPDLWANWGEARTSRAFQPHRTGEADWSFAARDTTRGILHPLWPG